MSSQSNALGQILLGPLTGLVAALFSLKAALVMAGILLFPIIFLYLQLRNINWDRLYTFVRDKNHVTAPSKELMFKNPTM